ncbi:MAG TPA: endolytic transglycosylase MltG [Porticoccaceae bacterium]|nr:endolytic transglycosylase MltG [Porticoccaceae bacterium]HCO58656.1 endolytic transglycosylase MltG [Porticoccaceae bacterium]
MFRRLIIIGAFLFLALAAGGWWWLGGIMGKPLSIKGEAYELVVPPGWGINSLASTLVEEGLLSSAIPLRIYARINRVGVIQAGEYRLAQGETPSSMLKKLGAGDVQRYSITFPEALTLSQWRDILAETSKLKQSLAGRNAADIARQLGLATDNPEGWFAPDTYSYTAGDTDLSILRRAFDARRAELARLWEQREKNLPLADPYEALILASIVDRETGLGTERARIAGVFVARLRKNMLLQTDPSVIYGLGKSFNGNLTRRHLRQDTPYNTYTRAGLPPTPIANPGVAALEAALHPESGNALYFVGKGDGSHYFSATLEEHNRAVRKYQIEQRKKTYRSSPKG